MARFCTALDASPPHPSPHQAPKGRCKSPIFSHLPLPKRTLLEGTLMQPLATASTPGGGGCSVCSPPPAPSSRLRAAGLLANSHRLPAISHQQAAACVTQTAACATNTAVCVTETAVSQLIHFQIHAVAARISNSPSPNPTPAESITIPQKGVGRGWGGCSVLQATGCWPLAAGR